MAWNPDARAVARLKGIAFVLALVPLARLVASGFLDRLGANPIEFITRNTGEWALIFLCLTLAVTPLRKALGWNWLARLRRMLGLFCFFYAALHFLTFLWFDHFFDVAEMLKDVARRPFILVGFMTFLLLLPLAVTSTNAMTRRLGGKRWQRLHRLVYVVGPLAILHFWWMKAGKNDFGEPLLYGAVVAFLLTLRIYWKVRTRRTGPGAAS